MTADAPPAALNSERGSLSTEDWREARRKEREGVLFGMGYLAAVADLGGAIDECSGKELIEQAVWTMGWWITRHPPIGEDDAHA